MVDPHEQGWAALLKLLNEMCFVRFGVKTYKMFDLQEQGLAALL